MLLCKISIILKILLHLILNRNCSVDNKDLEVTRKLRYYKEVINPNLEDQKYVSILISIEKKTNIAKIRMNSHELQSETKEWKIPKR